MRFVATHCMRQKSINDDYAQTYVCCYGACTVDCNECQCVCVCVRFFAHLFSVRMSLSHRGFVYYTHTWSDVIFRFACRSRNRVTGVRTMQTCDQHNNIYVVASYTALNSI